MHDLLQDIRYALRHWAKRPAVAILIVLTLAVGVGANAAIASIVNAVLLRPLPYPQPDRLVAIFSQFKAQNFNHFWISPPEYKELERWNKSFTAIGAYRTGAVNIGAPDEPLRVRSAIASATLFTALNATPLAGRPYTAEEDLPDGPPVVVIGERLWRRAFGADPALVGRTVEVDGRARTVVGVMPASFDVEDAGVDAWVPLALDPANPGGRASHYLYLIGRLKPDVSFEQAKLELAGLVARWVDDLPDTHVPSTDNHPILMQPLKEDLVGAARPKMLLLAGAVCLVLLIACANVANLLLARAEARQREVAVRTALGAGRGRLARQFLTEAVLLALAGGALGVVIAVWGVNTVLAANPGSVVRVDEIGLDLPLLAYTLAVAIATGLLFGLAPALHARARTFFAGLKDGARSSASRGRQLFRASLVVAEVALAFVLVIGAGLLLKSFWTLSRVDPGFEPKGALTFQLSLPTTAYPDGAATRAFYERLLEGLRSLPGVESATAMSGLPPVRDMNANDTNFEGVPRPPDGPIHNVDYYQFAAQQYFEAMKIRLVQGRVFEPQDAASTTPVVVVNQRLTEVFWPGQNPLGKRLQPELSDDRPWFTVVGVVADVKQGGMNRPAGTEIYFSSEQVQALLGFSLRTRNVVVRTPGDPLALAGAVRAEVAKLDPTLPVASLQTLEEAVSDSVSDPRLMTLLVAVFGAVALLLAAVGTYGVLSYAVEERRHEVGVRMALGSRPGGVLKLVLARGLTLVACGLVLGLAGTLAARKLIGRVLFEVAPTDPATYAAVAGILAAVAFLACFIPAQRATRVDPAVTLRSE